jgi:Zn-dependent M28 family amino/carboxypeptidase
MLATKLGAVGIVTIVTPVDRERLTWARILGTAGSSGMRWLEPDGTPHEGFPQLSGDAILSESGAKQLFALAERDLDALFDRHTGGSVGSFDFGISATLTRRSVQQHASSPNVVAFLRGSDKTLRDEYLLFTAHLDHLGIRAGGDGDDVYNGAYDNAAGVATLLEIAGALAKLSPPPRRSIVFAAVTAEEKGLRGSDFLAHNPPVDIEDIVANINIDMPFLGHPIADVEGFGVEHSTLQDALTTAIAELGLALTPDPRPELVRLIRSDQFSFVKQGVPGLNLKPGSMSTDPAIDGSELQTKYLHDHYHAHSDDLALPFSEDGAARFARAALAFGLLVANGNEAPRWKDGDFFGERYAKRENVDR